MARTYIGVLYPGDGYLDHEFWQFAPPDVSPLMTRTFSPPGHVTAEQSRETIEDSDIEATAQRFVVKLSSIVLACTSQSFIRGVGGDEDISRRIERATGVPATTTSTAMLRALRAVGARKVAVVTPYTDDFNVKLVEFLEGNGHEVVDMRGMQVLDGIGLIPPDEVARYIRGARHDLADAVFVSCTNFATADTLDLLEAELGRPVLSANQVSMWDALRLAGVEPRLEGRGSLFHLAMAVA
jgi:maleate isomerase